MGESLGPLPNPKKHIKISIVFWEEVGPDEGPCPPSKIIEDIIFSDVFHKRCEVLGAPAQLPESLQTFRFSWFYGVLGGLGSPAQPDKSLNALFIP